MKDDLVNRVAELAVCAYKMTYGEEKWNSLTDEQKAIAVHTVTMDTVSAMLKAIG